jgi:hypothetical protein
MIFYEESGSTVTNAYERKHTSPLPSDTTGEHPRSSPQSYRSRCLVSLESSLEPTGARFRLYFHIALFSRLCTFKLPQSFFDRLASLLLLPWICEYFIFRLD